MKNFTKAIISTFFLTINFYLFSQNQELSPSNFNDSIQNRGIQLLDVRTSNEYNQGHIKDAFQADWNSSDQFKERVLSLDKNKPVYVYCLAGSRSSAAQKWLIKEGFKTVVNLKGGINAWNLEDLPLEGKKDVEQIKLSDFLNSIPKDKTILIDIGAEWCPPCKKMKPIIEELEQEGIVILKIDGGAQTQLAKDLKAETFPTFIVYRNGIESKRVSGACSKTKLKELLD
ncbi:rhodanese-like domain-containing protein [Fluviicola taffensis]|uniref:Thioredoxin domain-containing protein n=1 Tax=Fluviicola taffensis (strain DSM 16823 / NCIMB 13979 / RW262) TaxID=755732 RepID=F2IIE8_FLUTR|nr:rhodanese-like domain-containing protein [Fluviicola taffensis]AEA44874.1 Thioredoxin domain-containing protein [Fluviicola taffensis DSM 16823]